MTIMKNIWNTCTYWSAGGSPAFRLERGRLARIRLLFCALLLITMGCGNQNKPEEPESLNGNVPNPEWSVVQGDEIISSMTAVIQVNGLEASGDDVLAAFAGDECRGVADYEDGLYFLYISGPAEQVALRFWSAHYKNVFVSEPFPFVNDSQLGTVGSPFTPEFLLMK